MTEYQAISARRACLQTATLLCAYAAMRYQKLTIPRNPALTFVAAGVLQGGSTQVRTPLGERSKWNWFLDGVSLGLVAYGTSKLELARRVKCLTGGVIGGAQLLISNARPHTFFGRVAAIDVKQDGAEEEVNALYDELVVLKDQLTPQDLIRACVALFLKARPFSYDYLEGSVAAKLRDTNMEAIEHLAGWEKAAAQMHYYELSNEHGIFRRDIDFSRVISEEGLSETETTKRQEWLDTTGFWITQRWSIWIMNLGALEGEWSALKTLIKTPGCRLTFDQKIDLCNEYIKKSHRLEGGIVRDSWCSKACIFKQELIEGLGGFEKCRAYMKHAEFFSRMNIRWPYLFSKIFPGIHPSLSPSEQSQFRKWMDETGNAIRDSWNRQF